ncbi:MAG: preprotein translocase subunit YajC [Kiritimatiellia bacterium]
MMESLFATITAMAGPGSEGQGGGLGGALIPMVLIFAIFYFMLIRPQQRKEKERRKMIEAAKTGDRILFCGGMLGTIANVKDQTFVVKIADNVKIEIARGSVNRVMEKGEKLEEDEKK